MRVVLFDVGGVLAELAGVSTILAWMDERINREELMALWLASPCVRAFETGRMDTSDFAEELICEMSLPVDASALIDEFTTWIRGPIPGAVELIASIPREITRATLCNTNALHWPRITGEMGLGRLFDYHFASHLTGKIKPDADAFLHVVETLECPPESIFFLDDNQSNVDTALEIGMRAARVNGVTGAEQALLDAGVIES